MGLVASAESMVASLDEAVEGMQRLVRACETTKQREQDKVGRAADGMHFYISQLMSGLGSLIIEDPSGVEGGVGRGPNTPIGYDRGRPIYR